MLIKTIKKKICESCKGPTQPTREIQERARPPTPAQEEDAHFADFDGLVMQKSCVGNITMTFKLLHSIPVQNQTVLCFWFKNRANQQNDVQFIYFLPCEGQVNHWGCTLPSFNCGWDRLQHSHDPKSYWKGLENECMNKQFPFNLLLFHCTGWQWIEMTNFKQGETKNKTVTSANTLEHNNNDNNNHNNNNKIESKDWTKRVEKLLFID